MMNHAHRITALLLLTFAAGCGASDEERHAQADGLAQTVLDLVAENNASRLYSEYGSTELRQQRDTEEWVEFIAGYSPKLGRPVEIRRTFGGIMKEKGVTVGDYEYTVTWEKASGTFLLKTRWRDGRWKLLGIGFKSIVPHTEAAEETSR